MRFIIFFGSFDHRGILSPVYEEHIARIDYLIMRSTMILNIFPLQFAARIET